MRPKNITVDSKSPRGITKKAFHLSPFLMLILLYPHLTSNLVNLMAPFIMSKSSWIKGKGQTLQTVCSLKW